MVARASDNGAIRRQELIAPAVVIEYASGDGSAERDRTPKEGKFWISEQVVHGGFYAIIVVETGELEVYRLEVTEAEQTARMRDLARQGYQHRDKVVIGPEECSQVTEHLLKEAGVDGETVARWVARQVVA